MNIFKMQDGGRPPF